MFSIKGHKISLWMIVASVIMVFGLYYGFILHQQFKYSPLLINHPVTGTQLRKFPSKKMPLAFENHGVQFTMNFWIYIKDWSYHFSNEKIIVNWKGKDANRSVLCGDLDIEDTREAQKNRIRQPSDVYKGNGGLTISLGARDNSLIFRHSLLNGKVDKIIIGNIPLQKWINVCVILEQRNLDIFLNGKLYASLKLSNMPVYSPKNLYISPHGGFLGSISKFQYFNRQINMGEIRNIFETGPLVRKPFFIGNEFKALDNIANLVTEDLDQVQYQLSLNGFSK